MGAVQPRMMQFGRHRLVSLCRQSSEPVCDVSMGGTMDGNMKGRVAYHRREGWRVEAPHSALILNWV